MYMKARCSLIILNSVSVVFPNSFMIADGIQKKLAQLVEVKDEIKQDLWTLATACNENLKKKIAKFPESSKIQ